MQYLSTAEKAQWLELGRDMVENKLPPESFDKNMKRSLIPAFR